MKCTVCGCDVRDGEYLTFVSLTDPRDAGVSCFECFEADPATPLSLDVPAARTLN
jgi:hypothetical protein